MKTKILFGSLLLASATVFSSCEDFLKEDPKGSLTAENFFNNQQELDMTLVSLYKNVQGAQFNGDYSYAAWMGDDITTNPGSNKQAAAQIDRFNVGDDNKCVKAVWGGYYNIVKAANYILLNAAKTPTSAEEINIALGNARFWRAWAYFYLVRTFGPIPMNLDNVPDDYTTPPSSIEDVYKVIVEDMQEAERILPTGYTKDPRHLFGVDVFITKQAAQSALSAVYMAMAGFPLNKGNEYYKLAANKAKEVIDGVNAGTYDFALLPEYKQVYSMKHNYNKETVVGVNTSPSYDWWSDSEFVLTQLFESQGGWGDSFGELRFWKRFPEGPRKAATYAPKIRLNEDKYPEGIGGTMVNFWDKITVDGNEVDAVPEKHPMLTLFTLNRDENGNPIQDQDFDYTKPYDTGLMCNHHRHRLIRYSEVLLWYAESAARAGMDLTDAKKYLKQVRQRAVEASEVDKVDGVMIDAMTADQLAKAAYDEHGWEVCGYFLAMVNRRCDQLRMNTLKDTFAERLTNAPVTVAPGVTLTEGVKIDKDGWNDNRNYLAYPSEEVQRNPSLKR